MLTQLEATTRKYHDKELKDCTKFRSYLGTKLMASAKEFADGRSYTWPIKYARLSMQWLAEYTKQERNPVEQITEAEEPYVFSSASVILSDQELLKNKGKQRILNLLSKKLAMLKDDTAKGVIEQLWTGNTGLEPRGILAQNAAGTATNNAWIDLTYATGSQSGTVATIVRGTNDTGAGSYTNWWQAQTTTSAGSITEAVLNDLIMDCTHDGDSPDTILAARAVFQYIYNIATGLEKENHSDLAKLGYKGITINGLAVTWDDDLTAANADALVCMRLPDWGLYFMKGSKMDRQPWFKPENQRAYACDMYNDFTFVCENPRNQGGLDGCTA